MKKVFAFLGVLLVSGVASAEIIRADFLYKCFSEDLYVKVITIDETSKVSVTDWQYVDDFGDNSSCISLAEKFNSK